MEGARRWDSGRLAVLLLLLSGEHLADGCRSPVVEILVSPLVDKTSLRQLELSWDVGENWRPGDWVGLYDRQPSQGVIPRFRANVDKTSGIVRTGVQEGRKLEDANFQKRCLGWWVAYWHANNNNPVAVSCLTSNPRWMEEMRNEIGKMKLNNIFLPGTHDSGAFLLGYSPFSDNRVNKYIYTQDETIMEQLIHGARILDLRISLDEGKFWVNHGIARLHPLEHVLNDVKTFVDNTKEIVILDCHEFLKGFKKPETHHKLIDYMKSIMGHQMAPPNVGWGTSLNTLWLINKRIIVAFNDKDIVKQRSNDVWWPVIQKWGNKRSITDLYNYFKNLFNGRVDNKGIFWSAMAEMTPNTWDILSDKLKGLRQMAENTNQQVTSWFRTDWGNVVNGVSVDFLRSSGIVDTAIRWNRRRAKGTLCD